MLSAIIADSNFATPSISHNSYSYDPTGSVWTFTSTAGVIYPPSSLSAPSAPAGSGSNQIAFLQTNRSASQYNGSQDGTISQSITLPSTGYFTFSVYAAADSSDVGSSWAAEESFMVEIDGAPVLTGLHPTNTSFATVGGTFYATAGSHTFSLVSTGPNNPTTTFIDDPQLVAATVGAATQLVFTTVSQSLATGVESSLMTLTLESAAGLAISAPAGGITVNLSSTSATGIFFNSGNALTSLVTIPAGSSSVSFYYKDAAAGSPTITAMSSGLTSATQQQSVQSVTSSSFLHTSGTNIVNAAGQTIELRGVNLGSLLIMEGWMSPLDSSGLPDEYGVIQTLDNRFGVATEQSLLSTYQQNWITTQDLENIKNEGFNVIRVPVWWADFETLQGQWRTDAFNELDWLVNTAGALGIYTIIDMHGVVGGESTSDDTGQANLDNYWTSPYDQQQTNVLWENIAQHYKNNPYVAGYDLMNEPDNAPSDPAVISAYDQLYSAVRSVDTNHIAIIEGTFDQWNWSMLPSPSSQGWTDVVYEMHEYQWNDTGNPSGVENGTNNQVSDFQNHSYYNVPDYIGEFNDFGTGSSTWQYAFQQFDNNNISWSFWSYKATDGTASSQDSWGLYDPINNLTVPNIQTVQASTISQDWTDVTTSSYFGINTMLQSALQAAGVPGNIVAWTGKDNNDNWSDPKNWSTGALPNSASDVIIYSGEVVASTAINVAALTLYGGELQLASNSGYSAVTSLNIAASGILDLTNNRLYVDFGPGNTDPVSMIYTYLQTGYNAGAWNGPGIDSSSAAANNLYALGYSDGYDIVAPGLSEGQVEIAYTLYGDANLDGTVNGTDFSILAAHFGQGATAWDAGDFTYTGVVNGTDFSLLAENFGQGATGAASGSEPSIAFAAAVITSNDPTTLPELTPTKKTLQGVLARLVSAPPIKAKQTKSSSNSTHHGF